jgi:DNA-binding NarL/FixJ family response regulator
MVVRILIVDDNPSFVAAVRQFLDFLPGAEVVGNARSAEEALGSARLLAPDLALIDVEIPGMHGLELAARMHQWPRPPGTMLMSMHDVGDYAAPAAAIGVLGLASKSDFVTGMLPAIERLVEAQTPAGAIGGNTPIPG